MRGSACWGGGTNTGLLKALAWYFFGSELPSSQREQVSTLVPIGKEGQVARWLGTC